METPAPMRRKTTGTVIPRTRPADRMVERKDGLVSDQGETDAICVCGIEDIVGRANMSAQSGELEDEFEEVVTVQEENQRSQNLNRMKARCCE